MIKSIAQKFDELMTREQWRYFGFFVASLALVAASKTIFEFLRDRQMGRL